jgi:hypothetical protein
MFCIQGDVQNKSIEIKDDIRGMSRYYSVL